MDAFKIEKNGWKRVSIVASRILPREFIAGRTIPRSGEPDEDITLGGARNQR